MGLQKTTDAVVVVMRETIWRGLLVAGFLCVALGTGCEEENPNGVSVEPECASATDCENDEICEDGICVANPDEPECESHADCEDGERCILGGCSTVPDCETDEDCDDGLV